MSAQADTNCQNIFNVVSATRTHLAKIGATCHVVPTCRDMAATFPAKLHSDWAIGYKFFTHHPCEFLLGRVTDHSLKSSSFFGLLDLVP